MSRLLLVGMVLTLLPMAWPVGNDLQAQTTPFLEGTSTGYGWTISVVGSSGIFQADGNEWQIEYIFQNIGLAGYKHDLWFLGRKSDNFITLHLYADDAGTSFIAVYYDYKRPPVRAERFVGAYDVTGLIANPTLVEGYSPHGRIPAYEGHNFHISSEYTILSPLVGSVSYNKLQVAVYPVMNAVVTPSWSEIWAIAIEPNSRHTYFLMFYTISSYAWIIDLWSGQVTTAPLGQVMETSDQVTIEHGVDL